jgi:hypothetical protein
MSLSDLAAVGSFVSGLAVLMSLIFLNLQVRQTARHQRSLLMQGQTDRWLGLQMRLAHPAMAPVWNHAVGQGDDLTLTEYRQVRHVVTAYFKSGEEAFIQYRDGLLTEPAFETARQLLKAFVSFPRVRVLWRQSRSLFDPDYVRLVDRIVQDMPLFAVDAALDDFNRVVADEISTTRVASPDEWAAIMSAGSAAKSGQVVWPPPQHGAGSHIRN